ncbi:hypothetical protein ACROYT_G003607 [Oculina patagonica]
MKLSLVIVVVVGLIQCQEGESKCFVQICSSNPTNEIRGCDNHGCGHYGADRPGRKHRGIDIVCAVGSHVYAPFPAEVERRSVPYSCDKHPHDCNQDYNSGVLLEGTGAWEDYEVMMWYFSKDVSDGQYLSAGSFMGTMYDRAAGASPPGMTNHVHVQLYKKNTWDTWERVDPTPYVC